MGAVFKKVFIDQSCLMTMVSEIKVCAEIVIKCQINQFQGKDTFLTYKENVMLNSSKFYSLLF